MRPRGFTLIELLVAIAIMALLAIMSWRGLDGMVRARTQTEARADEVLALQVGLAQWAADLDGIVQTPQLSALDWNGRVLRLTRRSSTAASDGVLVVAWARRLIDGRGQWLRWQSPPLTSRGALLEAWKQAALWAQNPGDEAKQREVAITPLDEWQIFYYRADAWTNPLSSDATASAGIAPGMAANPAAAANGAANIPDGVRLVLTLPPGQALTGKLTRDWVRPTVSGGKS
ncbi:MAG: prepilin-type N-terminal cleavage/methylation domain-containing protein [Ramlibacter sp.]|nr:prepilin-type N-terminal cleavage/methylation domain-containing protein [Ramlibacter sp.]